ncbi:MAG: Asp-tRNA(Asn)/Glu-tRNA(Gln) amidotransferase subunit GatC [Bacteroidota bacterium]|jgi:aspartyl-tRNA(Asn)/glutamyl-tRNA(Gln) amidotransferase subunit C
MTQIDDKLIQQLAHLARLEFDEAGAEEMKKDMNRMLEFVKKLDELNTENVEPLIYMNDEFNVWREDEIKGQVSQKDALRNAPVHDTTYFKVPRVVDKNKS